MDILISGGAGFIGVNFIQHLLDKYPDYNIVCIDTLLNDNKNLEFLEGHSRFYFYPIDVCSTELLRLFKFWYGFDMIVNFVPEQQGLFNFLEIIKKYKTKKFLQVYTDPEVQYTLFNIFSVFCNFKLPAISVSCFDNYGSFQYPNESIPLMITDALEGKKVQLSSEKTLCSVLDHCRALETLMHYGKDGESYILGGDKKVDSNEIATFIVNYLDIPKDMLVGVAEGSRLKRDYNLDYTRLNKEYGWNPIIDLNSGLIDTIEWYKENESWWKELKI